MSLSLKLFSLGVLFGGLLAHADPKLEDFYGFRIGMSEKEVLSVVKQKGFLHFAEAANGTLTTVYKPGTCIHAKIAAREMGVPYDAVVCVARKPNLDSIGNVVFEIFDGKVFALSTTFELNRGNQAMSGIIGKFGFPKRSEYLSGHTADTTSVEQIRCQKQTCNQSTWENSARKLTVSYIGSSPAMGEAVRLCLMDTVTMAKLKLLDTMNVIEKGAADAKDLGF
jgi:hypothetical protein